MKTPVVRNASWFVMNSGHSVFGSDSGSPVTSGAGYFPIAKVFRCNQMKTAQFTSTLSEAVLRRASERVVSKLVSADQEVKPNDSMVIGFVAVINKIKGIL